MTTFPTRLGTAALTAVLLATSPLGLVPRADAAVLEGTPGRDRLPGTAQDDVIRLYGGNDGSRGLAGDDRIVGGDGRDGLYGGDGDDRVMGGPGRDNLFGGAGYDVIVGGAGADQVWADPDGVDDLVLTGGGDDHALVYGGDRMRAGAGDDVIRPTSVNPRRMEIWCGPGRDEVLLPNGGDVGEPDPTRPIVHDCEVVKIDPFH
ncbi:hypothetical protein AB0N29_09925 [Nocardioides sp. NPDC092400]|uniref:calcium-binding protein n=1 Tax=Nocardioides sp. NPDC092400 TaxID=3155196 RepID=UPI0034376AED